jgi:hypothetical protein
MFKKSLKEFFYNPFITVPGILFSLIISIFSYSGINPEVIERIGAAGESGDLSSIGADVASFFSTILLILIISLFVTPLVISWSNLMVKDIVTEGDSNVTKNFKISFKYYWRMFSAVILKGLIFIGIAIVFAIIITPLMFSASNGSTSAITVIAITSIIFIFGGIFLIISLLPVESLLIYDDLTISKSFSKGFKFGAKKFFPILGASIPYAIILLIFYAILINYPYAYNVVNSYFGMFLVVYIMNIYRESKEPEDEVVNDTP